MSYCPEDGVVMEQVHQDAGSVCYRCPTCQSHVVYAPEWIGKPGYVFIEQECEFCGWEVAGIDECP